MKLISNSTISTLVRCLPLILANIDEEAMETNLRLFNAVRQIRQIIKKLKKTESDGIHY